MLFEMSINENRCCVAFELVRPESVYE